MHDPSVKMVDRIVSILRLLGGRDERGVALAEICAETELQKTNAHRILGALVDSGLVFQDVLTRNYRLGYAATALGRSALEQDVASAARVSLIRLAAKSGDTAFASVHEGTAAICVAREVGEFPIRTLTLSVGDRRPLGVGAGSLALLAALADDVIDKTLKRNEAWLKDFRGFSAGHLRKLVERTRKDGYAINEGGIVPGMNAVGIAVVDETGLPLAALSVAAIKDRMGKSRILELADVLGVESRSLAAMMRAPRLAAE
jgi:DNA-binding IclR family transcriptional regulator